MSDERPTVFKIETDDVDQHRLFLAGPDIYVGIEGLDNALRALTKYGTWPGSIGALGSTVEGLCDWVRGEIAEIIRDSGIRN